MPLTEEATDEIAALSAIMGNDFWLDASESGKVVLCVAPEVDDSTEIVGLLALLAQLPPGYPDRASAVIECTSVASYASLFEHRAITDAAAFVPTAEQCAALAAVVADAIADRPGEVH
jgi:hypothetical protein